MELLLNFAKDHQLNLKLLDDKAENYFLPGKPLSESELINLIESSRKSGSISLEKAHGSIRKAFSVHPEFVIIEAVLHKSRIID